MPQQSGRPAEGRCALQSVPRVAAVVLLPGSPGPLGALRGWRGAPVDRAPKSRLGLTSVKTKGRSLGSGRLSPGGRFLPWAPASALASSLPGLLTAAGPGLVLDALPFTVRRSCAVLGAVLWLGAG